MLLRLLGRKGRVPTQTSKERGDLLEKRVERMFKRMLKFNVKRHTIVRDLNGNISEIDVTYGIIFKKYIECKNFTGPVPLEYVAKFKEVLKLNRISPRSGLFITTSYYTPRATTIGIKTIDGTQLDKLERRAVYYGILKGIGLGAVLIALGGAAFIHATHKGGFTQFVNTYWSNMRKRNPAIVGKIDRFVEGIHDTWNEIKWKIR
jgi:hypothetical protein